jgi:hypothetical protein
MLQRADTLMTPKPPFLQKYSSMPKDNSGGGEHRAREPILIGAVLEELLHALVERCAEIETGEGRKAKSDQDGAELHADSQQPAAEVASPAS